MQTHLPPFAFGRHGREGIVIDLPAGAVLPDYGSGGLYGLARDYAGWLGDGARSQSAAAELPRIRVLLLIDGLGDAFLRREGVGSRLLAHRQGRLTSVFPSTTASAVTTLLTGLPPLVHGLNGWFIHDRRFGGVIAPLPMMRRAEGPLDAPFLLRRLFPYDSMFRRARRTAIMVSPRKIAFSPFSRRHVRGARVCPHDGLEHMIDVVADEVAALPPQGGFIHAYYTVFDALSHDHGSAAQPVIDCFARIDAAFSRLLDRLAGSGVELSVTADHGFADASEERLVDLSLHPDLTAMLAAPLFGEQRAAFCEVRRGAEAEFEAWAPKELAGKARVVRSSALVAAGLLGPGKAHRRLRERVGTHALLMEAGWIVRDRLPGERPHWMPGVHGGLSAEEMYVPLIRVRC